MGGVTGMLGLGGGAAGTGFDGPQGTNLTGVVNGNQLNAADTGVNNSLVAQQNLLAALQGQNGLGNQNQVYGQLQGVANGTGPNPAQAQYQQNIQDLAKQQSGAISSIQGISPALAARMASQQGSAAMQNAAGQGGANLANQQLGAMQAAGNMATTQAGQQIGQTNANQAAEQARQNTLMNAANGQNANQVSMQGNINNANSSMANTEMGGQQKIVGGLMTGAGMGAKTATGGAPGMANGGQVTMTQSANGPQSRFAQSIASRPGAMMAEGGKVPALVSPGELWLPPGKVQQVAKGKDPMKVGEKIPGKPKVKGNSYANDVVPKKLDVGGIVIPNSIMQSKDPAAGAKDFIAGIIAKRKGRK